MTRSPRRHHRLGYALVAAFAVVGVWACAPCQPRGGDVAIRPSPAVATTAPATAPAGAKLTVTVIDLRRKKGNLIFGVFDAADGFPNVEAKSIHWEVKDADAKTVTFTAHLPPGRYGASVLHDENRNGDMDRGFAGIPLEGYGVTNNPKPPFRAATFDEATFDLPEAGREMTISVQYF